MTVTAHLSMELSLEEIQSIWEYERGLDVLDHPCLSFEVHGYDVDITLDPGHIPPKDPGEIRKTFRFAVHRKYPDCVVE